MNTDAIRINKAIARAGLASRREADRLIRAGKVRLNGQVLTDLGRSILPLVDHLEVAGQQVNLRTTPEAEVWALYKPKRVVSTLNDPEGRASLADYLPNTPKRLFPVGRLDYDAEGLILLTNDGELAHRVAHPSFEVEKIYLVKVKGLVTAQSLQRLARGPLLEGRRRGGVKARVLHKLKDKTWLEVTLQEGIQHHIKKMFKPLGHMVLKIKRYQVGPVELGDLKPGQSRRLDKEQVDWMLMDKPQRHKRKRPRPSGVGRQ